MKKLHHSFLCETRVSNQALKKDESPIIVISFRVYILLPPEISWKTRIRDKKAKLSLWASDQVYTRECT